MDKKRIVKTDLKDPTYQKRLCEFLEKHYGETFEMLPDHAEVPAEMTVLMITDRELTEEERESLKERYFPVLEMQPGGALDPYQSGHGIAKAIFTAVKQAEEERDKRIIQQKIEDAEEKSPSWMMEMEDDESIKDYRSRMLLTYAVSGGSGLTCLSRALAEEWGQYGRTLLAELGGPSDWRDVFSVDVETGGISDLIYSFLAEPEQVFHERIEAWAAKQECGIFYLKPVDEPEDLWALDPAETETFWKAVASHFDQTIIEAGKQWTPLSRYAAGAADVIGLLQNSEITTEEARLRSRIRGEKARIFSFVNDRKQIEEKARGKGIFAVRAKETEEVFRLPDREMPEDGGISYQTVIREAVHMMG